MLSQAIADRNPHQYVRVNYEFHLTIYRASGSDVLLSLIESLWLQVSPFSICSTVPKTTKAPIRRAPPICTSRAILVSYVASGALASIAGILLSTRVNAAKADYGTSYLLETVLISVLGGTNPAGGKATVLRGAIALVSLMLLSSGFQLMRFSNFLVDFIWGAFLLIVIAINALRSRTR